ncbi:serine/threonine-protein phosphatase 1 regulatory subunit 10-like isoform X2 [Lineus longissimus]|uniref:serine/threonine-protein phosphatase 1 regulatory subunit 10-like isoform X2 n=1 Tax=Lineus longissimus TaxID=88925 RepID=UPI00315CE0C1
MVSPEAEPMNWNLSETDSLLDEADSQTDIKSLMEMACVEPSKMLKALSPHLGVDGDIKNEEEIAKLVVLMKEAKKLVCRCVFVNVLRATRSRELFEKFIDDGGWDLLNVWLQDAKSDENTPFLLELLHLYQMMPVSKFSVELLKSNNCAKTIKGLCKLAETDEIKNLSNEIVERWMDRIREIRESDAALAENAVNSGDKDGKKKKKHKKSDRSKEEKKIKTEGGNGDAKEGNADDKLRSLKIKDLKDKIKEENDKLDKHKHRHGHSHHHKSSSKDKEHRRHSNDGDKRKDGDKSDKHRHDKHRRHDDKKKDGLGSGSSSRHRDHRLHSNNSDTSTHKKTDGNTAKIETPNVKKEENSGKLDVLKKPLNKRTSEHFLSNDIKPKVLKTSSLLDVKSGVVDRKDGKERPKTVKPFTTKFRDTGLTEQPSLPVRRKVDEVEREKLKLVIKKTPSGSAMVTTSTSATSISSNNITISSTSTTTTKPLERKPRPVLPAPVVRTNSQENQKSSPTETSPGKIKLIPPQKRPKAYELADSSDFMNALIAPPPVVPLKKKRKTSIGTIVKQPSTPTSPPTPTKNVPSFYKETLDTSEVKQDKGLMGESEDFPMADGEQGAAKKAEMSMAGGDASSATDTESVGSQSSNNNNGKKKKKKTVSWRDEKFLRSVHFFEMDEHERVNVNKHNFEDMKKQEMATERHGMERAKAISADKMAEKMTWRRPSLISNLTPRTTEHGARSTERDVQRSREQGVLQAIFFSKEMIPDTPMEPEMENTDVEEPRIIPLEDESTGEDAYVPTDDSTQGQQQQQQHDTTSGDNQQTMDQIAAGGQAQASLPPEIASLLGQISSQVGAQNPPAISASDTSTSAMQAPALPPQITGMLETLTQNAQQPIGAVDPITGAAPDPSSILTSVQSLLTNFMDPLWLEGQNGNPEVPNQDQAQHDVLTEKLKQILEPFQKQLAGTMAPPPAGMMLPHGAAPPPFPIPMPPPVGPDGKILPPPPGIRFPPGMIPTGVPPPLGGIPGVPVVGRPQMRPPFPAMQQIGGRGMVDDFGGQRFQGNRVGRGNFPQRGGRGGTGPPRGGGGFRGRGRDPNGICNYFQGPKGCWKGENCQFRHVKPT